MRYMAGIWETILKGFNRMRRHVPSRLRLTQTGIVATFALIPLWLRFRGAPPSFDTLYSTGFVVFWPMFWSIAWWLLAGLPGFAELRRDPVRRAWALALLLLALWGFLSWTWAYVRPFRSDATLSAALPFAVAALFALVTTCVGPSPRIITVVLIVGLAWNSLIADLQVAAQASLGVSWLGEFDLNPAISGVSVVLAEGVRWLRPYGLLAHPNMLAGFLAVSLLTANAWLFTRHVVQRWIGTVILLFGLWTLLLTFSRAAWLGFAVGAAAVLLIGWHIHNRRRGAQLSDSIPLLPQVVLTVGLATLALGLFVWLYWPFIVARTGVSAETIEQRSISDRVIYEDLAWRAIREQPVIGLGVGNFPWRASYYLMFTDFDLQGQPVHNIYLLVWSELGLIGLILMLVAMVTGLWSALWTIDRDRLAIIPSDQMVARLTLWGGFIALAIIGFFDHYPWTLLQFQALWWGGIAVSGQPAVPLSSEKSGAHRDAPRI